MNTPKAILIGFAMIAVAVYFSRDVGPAQAGAHQAGRYMISGAGDTSRWAWILETPSGRFRRCEKNGKCQKWYNSQ